MLFKEELFELKLLILFKLMKYCILSQNANDVIIIAKLDNLLFIVMSNEKLNYIFQFERLEGMVVLPVAFPIAGLSVGSTLHSNRRSPAEDDEMQLQLNC